MKFLQILARQTNAVWPRSRVLETRFGLAFSRSRIPACVSSPLPSRALAALSLHDERSGMKKTSGGAESMVTHSLTMLPNTSKVQRPHTGGDVQCAGPVRVDKQKVHTRNTPQNILKKYYLEVISSFVFLFFKRVFVFNKFKMKLHVGATAVVLGINTLGAGILILTRDLVLVHIMVANMAKKSKPFVITPISVVIKRAAETIKNEVFEGW